MAEVVITDNVYSSIPTVEVAITDKLYIAVFPWWRLSFLARYTSVPTVEVH